MRKFAEIAYEYDRAENEFTDSILFMVDDNEVFDWLRTSHDGYDDSIEFHDVIPNARLNKYQQKYIFDNGFQRCWLNHEDGWQTYYYWNTKFEPCEGTRTKK